MQTCRYVANSSTALYSKLKRRPSPDMAVIDACRCYHRSLDITAAKGRRTHPQVAEQLWPGSRLACRANVSARQAEADCRRTPSSRVPTPSQQPGTRASNCTVVTTTLTQIALSSKCALGVAWPPLRTANLRDGRTGAQCFSLLAGCSLLWRRFSMSSARQGGFRSDVMSLGKPERASQHEVRIRRGLERENAGTSNRIHAPREPLPKN